MRRIMALNEGWLLQSSEKVAGFGETLSTTEYSPQNWYPVSVPTTVVNGLAENGVFEDPYKGLNMKGIPGYKQGINLNFSNFYKPEDSPFRAPWWFRREFVLQDYSTDEQIWLLFKGINYAANIWLNGKRIAGLDYVTGTYRRYDFDITRFVNYDVINVLALEVFSPNPDDLALTFIDWAPAPPDDCMGIWQPVMLYTTRGVAIKHPLVKSCFDLDILAEAKLNISTELHNRTKQAVTGLLEGTIENISFSQAVTLNPSETKLVVFGDDKFPQLMIQQPRIWWPYQLGSPELYRLNLEFKINGVTSDEEEISFGIREFSTSLNEYGARVFQVNGRKILIKGAAWSPDLMLRQSEHQDEIDITFLKNLNLNTVRLEGKFATEYFWDLCDREGILVMAGWPCCNYWEMWDQWKEGDLKTAAESLRSQILRLRNHPSFLVWLNGSDFPPPEMVEEQYLHILNELYAELPVLSNAAAKLSTLTGETGVKMSGPYHYVPPIYWYTSAAPGVAEKFNTETGPNVCIPIWESLVKMLPPNQRYVGSEVWNLHCGLGPFNNTILIDKAIYERYGKPVDLVDYCKTAQLLGYECWRAMYEAHNRNFPIATGVIGWMLNSPWPNLIWHLYDYYLNPTGGFFGSQKACEALHIQYSYDDATVWVINSSLEERGNLTVTTRVFNSNAEERLVQTEKINIKGNSNLKVGTIPELSGLSSVYFVVLTITDRQGLIVRNFYWLATKPDVFDFEAKVWYHTPLKEHADLSALRNLPQTVVQSIVKISEKAEDYEIIVDITNISKQIAFFLWVKVIDERTQELVAPVYWSENCISLLPGEVISLNGSVPKYAIIENMKMNVKIEGWNI